MVLILSTSAIIGAKTSAVPHFLTGLPFWIVASGNIGAWDSPGRFGWEEGTWEVWLGSCLVGGLEQFLFSHILGLIIPID